MKYRIQWIFAVWQTECQQNAVINGLSVRCCSCCCFFFRCCCCHRCTRTVNWSNCVSLLIPNRPPRIFTIHNKSISRINIINVLYAMNSSVGTKKNIDFGAKNVHGVVHFKWHAISFMVEFSLCVRDSILVMLLWFFVRFFPSLSHSLSHSDSDSDLKNGLCL